MRDLGESTIPYAVNGHGDITGARTIGVRDDLFADGESPDLGTQALGIEQSLRCD